MHDLLLPITTLLVLALGHGLLQDMSPQLQQSLNVQGINTETTKLLKHRPEFFCREDDFIAVLINTTDLQYEIEIRKKDNIKWEHSSNFSQWIDFQENRTVIYILNLTGDTAYDIRLWGIPKNKDIANRDKVLYGPSTLNNIRTHPIDWEPKPPPKVRLKKLYMQGKSYTALIDWDMAECKSCFYDIVWFNGIDLFTKEFPNVTGKLEVEVGPLQFEQEYNVGVATSTSNFKRDSSKTYVIFTTESCANVLGSDTLECISSLRRPFNLNAEEVPIEGGNSSLYNIIVSWKNPQILPEYYKIILSSYLQNSIIYNKNCSANSVNYTFLNVNIGSQYTINLIPHVSNGSIDPVVLHRNRALREEKSNVLVRSTIFSFWIIFSIAAIAATIWFFRQRYQKQIKMLRNHYEDRTSDQADTEMTEIYNSGDSCDDIWEIDARCLQTICLLGEGAFGVVSKAWLSTNSEKTLVAVKMLREHAHIEEINQFRKEAEIMKSVGNHPNVVSLIGYCSKGFPKNFRLVVEYCSKGNLLSYLRTHAKVPFSLEMDVMRYTQTSVDNTSVKSLGSVEGITFANMSYLIQENICGNKQLLFKDLVYIAWQIACGMEHLSSLHLVHRDLAARNVLVCEDNRVKVSDFGLSRDVYIDNVYIKVRGGTIPLKWTALESLVQQSYTSKSDVWSFGILLWEIFTMGANPYPHIIDSLELIDKLRNGYRMECPKNCCQEIHAIMMECWKQNPDDRPSFTELKETLDNYLEKIAMYVNVKLPVIPCNAKVNDYEMIHPQNNNNSFGNYLTPILQKS